MSDDDRNAKPDDLHAQAIRRADEAFAAERENIESARDAQRFYAGEQWNDAAKLAREKEGRPCLTINRLPAFVKQVTGDVRKDTPSMRFLPATDGANEKTAEVITGLVRNIEQASNAKAAYVQAVDNACQAGIGWIRVNTEYSDDDSFDQDIRIRRVTDPLGVLCDPSAQEPDKSDSQFMIVYEDMSHDKFKRQFPDATLDDFPSPPTGGMIWKTEKTVRVAEYWYRKPEKKTLYLHEDGTVSDEPPKEGKATTTRSVDGFSIWQCIVSGRAVIREAQKWNGRYFPFAPVLGEEIRLDGRTIRKGMVHDARGSQQAYNYARSAAVEATSAQPKMPYILTSKQLGNRTDEWAALGTSNPAYVVYDSDPQAPGAPQRVQPPPVQTGLDSQAMLAANELEAIIGIYKSGLGAPSNETSGRAILARQREGDTGTYLYIDNLATALRRIGIILMDLIPAIYDTPRYVRVLKEDGTHDMAWVNKEEEGEDEFGKAVMKIEHDMSLGEYDVIVSTGPSFQTRRQEAAESARQMIQAYPPLMQIAGDLMLKSLDIPYADEMAKRLERTIAPELKEDNAQPPPPPPPNPRDVAAALKDGAATDKIVAETNKIELENVQLTAQIAAVAAGLPQLLQLMQQITQGQQGAQPQGEAGPQPAAPPMGEAPPQAPMQMDQPPPADMGDGLPPTVELTSQEMAT